MKTLTGWLCLVMLGGWLVLPALTLAQDDSQPTPLPVKMCGEQAHCCMPAPPPSARRCPLCPILRVLLPLLVVIHVMLAVWVYTDIKKRGEGPGVFIILALLGGIPATILYALVRIGDRKS